MEENNNNQQNNSNNSEQPQNPNQKKNNPNRRNNQNRNRNQNSGQKQQGQQGQGQKQGQGQNRPAKKRKGPPKFSAKLGNQEWEIKIKDAIKANKKVRSDALTTFNNMKASNASVKITPLGSGPPIRNFGIHGV